MTSDGMWLLFAETGEIAYYLLYRELLEEETAVRTA